MSVKLFALKNIFILVQRPNFILYFTHFMIYLSVWSTQCCTIRFLHQFSCITYWCCAKSFILSFSLVYVTNTFILRFKPLHYGTSQLVYNYVINVTRMWWYLNSCFFIKIFLHFITTIKRKSSMDWFYFREKANILISTGLLWVN